MSVFLSGPYAAAIGELAELLGAWEVKHANLDFSLVGNFEMRVDDHGLDHVLANFVFDRAEGFEGVEFL